VLRFLPPNVIIGLTRRWCGMYRDADPSLGSTGATGDIAITVSGEATAPSLALQRTNTYQMSKGASREQAHVHTVTANGGETCVHHAPAPPRFDAANASQRQSVVSRNPNAQRAGAYRFFIECIDRLVQPMREADGSALVRM
jgi:hypothetical protein